MIAQWINFLIILLIFKWFLGDKITQAIQDRRKELAKAEGASKVYEDAIQKAESEKKRIIDKAMEHKSNLIAEAKQVAQQKADEIVQKAEKDASNITKDAQEHAKQLEKDLKNWFTSGVKETTHKVVHKLFDNDPDLKEEYIERLISEYNG